MAERSSLCALTSVVSVSEDRKIKVKLKKDINVLSIKLFWTKTHMDKLRNESVDDLSIEAALRDIIDLNWHPNNYMKRHYKYMKLWQKRWDNHEKCLQLYRGKHS